MAQTEKPYKEVTRGKGGSYSGIKRGQQGSLAALYGLGLYEQWDTMNPVQKGLYMSRFGLSAYQFGTGKDLSNTFIPGTQKYGLKGLTVSEGLGLVQSGYDLYSGIKYWDSMNATGRVLFGANTIRNTIESYDAINQFVNGYKAGNPLTSGFEYGALSSGLSAYNLYSTAANWNKMDTTQQIGAGLNSANSINQLYNFGNQFIWNKAAEAGVQAGSQAAAQGAAQGTSQAAAQGTSQAAAQGTSQAGSQVAAQGGSQLASEGAMSMSANYAAGNYGALAGQAIGGVAGAYGVYSGGKLAAQNWGTGGAQGRATGAMAGGMAAAGALGIGVAVYGSLAAMGPAGWIAAGALFAASMIGGSIKTGKSTSQGQRDMVRKSFKNDYGLIGVDQETGKYNLTLSNGKTVDVGIDGHGKYEGHMMDGKQLQPWDVNYKNDMDFFAGTSGIALSRILMGGDGQGHMAAIDQEGSQLGNAVLSGTVGFGKDMTRENFDTVRKEMIGQYAKAGVKTKEEYYRVVDEMAKQKRITEEQQISMRQIGGMLYDKDGYNQAEQLYRHRQPATDAVVEQAKEESAPAKPIAKPIYTGRSQAEIIAANRAKYQRSEARA